MIAHSTTADATPDVVWSALQDATSWEGIAGIEGIHQVSHTDTGLLDRFAFHIVTAGMRFDAVASVVRRQPPNAMTLALDARDVTARVAVRVKGDAAPVTVAVGIEFAPRSTLVRMALPAVERAVRTGLPRELEAFARRLSGDDS